MSNVQEMSSNWFGISLRQMDWVFMRAWSTFWPRESRMHRLRYFDLWWVFSRLISAIVNKYEFCVSDLKACEENKCQNGGKCKETGTDEYSCLCPIGFTGKYCECNYNCWIYRYNFYNSIFLILIRIRKIELKTRRSCFLKNFICSTFRYSQIPFSRAKKRSDVRKM
jgi:hypothetical protein